MENPIVQTPATTNQIEAPKPSVPKTNAVISSPIGNSMNGGHHKVISWEYVMAGQYLEKGQLNLNIQMLTPKTPAYQRLTANVKLIYGPFERAWKKYLEYIGQRGGTSVEKITKKPSFGGKKIPYAVDTNYQSPSNQVRFTPITNTTIWRDHWISSFIPRIGYQEASIQGAPDELNTMVMDDYDALPARIFVATYNDVLRNREYEKPIPEFTEMDEVTDLEWSYLMPRGEMQPSSEEYISMDVQQLRARRNNSYYTNYRTELQGIDLQAPAQTDSEKALLNWMNYEAKADLARSTAEDAQAREIDILAKIRGAKKLSEGRIQVLAEKNFDINYSAITQSAYNTNEQIEEKFQVMGQQGAYSYTNIQLPIGEDTMFLSDGIIMLVMTITAETLFETGIPRRRTTVYAIDEYRPELEDDKLDVIYDYEFGTALPTVQTLKDPPTVIGYKRKFNQYYCGNPVIAGDMTSYGYYEINGSSYIDDEMKYTFGERIESNQTYQFYEIDGQWLFSLQDTTIISGFKKIWLDYTDIAINNNQAILNELDHQTDSSGLTSFRIKGNNQIFFVGEYVISTRIPVTEKAKNNFSEWGEH